LNKNLFSIAIIVLAVAFVIVSMLKPSTSEKSKNIDSNQDDTATSEISKIGGSTIPQEGQPAPDFELVTLEGETVKLSDYKGKKVILNFWATWCPPCKAEMPHMQEFYEKNKEQGIEILAVNLTNLDNGKTDIKKFVEDYELTFTIPLDEEGVVGMQYQSFTIPTSYIIDTSGVISKKIVGPMNEEMMSTLTKDIN